MTAAAGLALASVFILVVVWLVDRKLLPPEDRGHVSPGYMARKGWVRR